MEKINSIKIRGIEITNTGVYIKRPFSETSAPFKKLDISNYLNIAQCLAKVRMEHCYNELLFHIHEAHITPNVISWEEGHFTIPVYLALERVLELNSVYKLDSLQTQQLIRAITFNTNGLYVVDYENNLNVKITDEFKMFLTEHILVCER